MRNFFLLVLILFYSFFGTIQAGADDAKNGNRCFQLLSTVCNDCHNTDRVCASIGGTQKKWKSLIDWMISNGVELSDDDQELLINCLSEPFDEAKKVCKK